MYKYVLLNEQGEEVFSHSEPTYDLLESWCVGFGCDAPIEAKIWQVVDPAGTITQAGRWAL